MGEGRRGGGGGGSYAGVHLGGGPSKCGLWIEDWPHVAFFNEAVTGKIKSIVQAQVK